MGAAHDEQHFADGFEARGGFFNEFVEIGGLEFFDVIGKGSSLLIEEGNEDGGIAEIVGGGSIVVAAETYFEAIGERGEIGADDGEGAAIGEDEMTDNPGGTVGIWAGAVEPVVAF